MMLRRITSRNSGNGLARRLQIEPTLTCGSVPSRAFSTSAVLSPAAPLRRGLCCCGPPLPRSLPIGLMRRCLISPAAVILTAPTAGESTTATFTSAPSRAASAILDASRAWQWRRVLPGSNPANSAAAPPARSIRPAPRSRRPGASCCQTIRGRLSGVARSPGWTAEKYRRFDRGDGSPDWRVGELRPPRDYGWPRVSILSASGSATSP